MINKLNNIIDGHNKSMIEVISEEVKYEKKLIQFISHVGSNSRTLTYEVIVGNRKFINSVVLEIKDIYFISNEPKEHIDKHINREIAMEIMRHYKLKNVFISNDK